MSPPFPPPKKKDLTYYITNYSVPVKERLLYHMFQIHFKIKKMLRQSSGRYERLALAALLFSLCEVSTNTQLPIYINKK